MGLFDIFKKKQSAVNDFGDGVIDVVSRDGLVFDVVAKKGSFITHAIHGKNGEKILQIGRLYDGEIMKDCGVILVMFHKEVEIVNDERHSVVVSENRQFYVVDIVAKSGWVDKGQVIFSYVEASNKQAYDNLQRNNSARAAQRARDAAEAAEAEKRQIREAAEAQERRRREEAEAEERRRLEQLEAEERAFWNSPEGRRLRAERELAEIRRQERLEVQELARRTAEEEHRRQQEAITALKDL